MIMKIKLKGLLGLGVLGLACLNLTPVMAQVYNGPSIRPYYLAPSSSEGGWLLRCPNNVNLVGSNNAERSFRFFVMYGLTAEQSAGIVGNLVRESGPDVDPSINQVGGGPGRGIAQWEVGGRWDSLQAFARGRGVPERDLESQLLFIWFELTGTPPTQGVTGGTEARAYRDLVEQTTVNSSAASFGIKFERARDLLSSASEEARQAEVERRQLAAQAVHSAFSGTTLVSGGDLATDSQCQSGHSQVSYDVHGCPDGPVERTTGEIVRVPDSVGGSLSLHQCLAEAAEALFADINRAFSGDRVSGGGWRSNQRQIELRAAHCGGDDDYTLYLKPSGQCDPPTAIPGRSRHERGLAIDFTVDGSTMCYGKSSRSECGHPVFAWLVENAESYGLYNLPSEGWHWSTDGG